MSKEQADVHKTIAAGMKVQIAVLEQEIQQVQTNLYELKNKREALITERAQIICPFVVGDRIKFDTSRYWNAASKEFKEGIVVGIRGTYGDGFELSYKLVLKGGKISETVRRLWNNRHIVERNGQPIEIKDAF